MQFFKTREWVEIQIQKEKRLTEKKREEKKDKYS